MRMASNFHEDVDCGMNGFYNPPDKIVQAPAVDRETLLSLLRKTDIPCDNKEDFKEFVRQLMNIPVHDEVIRRVWDFLFGKGCEHSNVGNWSENSVVDLTCCDLMVVLESFGKAEQKCSQHAEKPNVTTASCGSLEKPKRKSRWDSTEKIERNNIKLERNLIQDDGQVADSVFKNNPITDCSYKLSSYKCEPISNLVPPVGSKIPVIHGGVVRSDHNKIHSLHSTFEWHHSVPGEFVSDHVVPEYESAVFRTFKFTLDALNEPETRVEKPPVIRSPYITCKPLESLMKNCPRPFKFNSSLESDMIVDKINERQVVDNSIGMSKELESGKSIKKENYDYNLPNENVKETSPNKNSGKRADADDSLSNINEQCIQNSKSVEKSRECIVGDSVERNVLVEEPNAGKVMNNISIVSNDPELGKKSGYKSLSQHLKETLPKKKSKRKSDENNSSNDVNEESVEKTQKSSRGKEKDESNSLIGSNLSNLLDTSENRLKSTRKKSKKQDAVENEIVDRHLPVIENNLGGTSQEHARFSEEITAERMESSKKKDKRKNSRNVEVGLSENVKECISPNKSRKSKALSPAKSPKSKSLSPIKSPKSHTLKSSSDLETVRNTLLVNVLKKKKKKAKRTKLKEQIGVLRNALEIVIDQISQSPHTEKTVIKSVLSRIRSFSHDSENVACTEEGNKDTEVGKKKKSKSRGKKLLEESLVDHNSGAASTHTSKGDDTDLVEVGKRHKLKKSKHKVDRSDVVNYNSEPDKTAEKKDADENQEVRHRKRHSTNRLKPVNATDVTVCRKRRVIEIDLTGEDNCDNVKISKKLKKKKNIEENEEVAGYSSAVGSEGVRRCRFLWKNTIIDVLRSHSPNGVPFQKLQKLVIHKYLKLRGKVSLNTPGKFERYLLRVPGVTVHKNNVTLSEVVNEKKEEYSKRRRKKSNSLERL